MSASERVLFQIDNLPIFQNRMYESEHAARTCPRGQMRLVEDLKTGLVHNEAFDARLMEYDNTYQNEQGNSASFRAHMNKVADLVLSEMGTSNLIEVGCGKGLFLEILWQRGVDATGFDPVYEGKSKLVEKAYFSEELGIQGHGLILRHVLEHIEDPVKFLHRLATANGCQGLIYIEVPCLDWIIDNHAWFDIFYEHVNYFRLQDFQHIFGRVVHSERTFGGQYLSVIADLSTIQAPKFASDSAVDFPPNMLSDIQSSIQDDCEIVVWGGASKGVIFSLHLERAGRKIDRVIDINPAKQGKYLPGTGLRVLPPSEGLADLPHGSVIHVMNPNYLDEIREMSGHKFKCKVP
jgi:hypothetical protein